MQNIQGDSAIIEPLQSATGALDHGPVGILVSSQADLNLFSDVLDLTARKSRKLFMSRVYQGPEGICVAGPYIGAPYAVMILETLIAWGVRTVLAVGWCGAISPRVKIGDVVIPSAALIEEGTSIHYLGRGSDTVRPSDAVVDGLVSQVNDCDISWHKGTVWSTDAIYRETREKVIRYQAANVLAVEMETSALFSVGKFRCIDVGAIVVVSDELAELQWRPGFRDKRFKTNRRKIAEIVSDFARKLANTSEKRGC